MSYYAATANVCVIGAGSTGVATALTLAERGCPVVGLEVKRVDKYGIDCVLKDRR